MPLHRLEHTGRGEFLQVHVAAAEHRHHGRLEVGRVEHRRNMQVDVVLGGPHDVRELQRIGQHVAMRQAHALGTSGGAAGVEQQRVVALVDGVRRRG